MVKKRIIGVVNILNGWAVQSFSYTKYLPLGKPECLIENLDRWGADEIVVQVLDGSINLTGPDLKLLEKIGKIGLSTPIVYTGGIRNSSDAKIAIELGADRVAVDALLKDHPDRVKDISSVLGAQALIASIPLVLSGNDLQLYNYRTRKSNPISAEFISFLNEGFASEIMISDVKNEGLKNGFENKLINIPVKDIPLIVFGGITEFSQMRILLEDKRVNGIMCGNSLSYEEMRIQKIKENVSFEFTRKPAFFSSHD